MRDSWGLFSTFPFTRRWRKRQKADQETASWLPLHHQPPASLLWMLRGLLLSFSIFSCSYIGSYGTCIPSLPLPPPWDFYKELPTNHHTSANFTETGVCKYLTGEAHGGKPNDSPAVDPGKVVWVTSSSSATLSENVHGCYPHIGSSLCLWGPETDLDCGPAGSNSNSVCH